MTLGFVEFLAYVTRPEPKGFHLRGGFLWIFSENHAVQAISGQALTSLAAQHLAWKRLLLRAVGRPVVRLRPFGFRHGPLVHWPARDRRLGARGRESREQHAS